MEDEDFDGAAIVFATVVGIVLLGLVASATVKDMLSQEVGTTKVCERVEG